MKINLALIDDDVALLEQIKTEFQEFSHIHLLFSANNGEDCVNYLKKCEPHQLPHIILMDISMPMLNGIEATLQISSYFPEIQVVIFTNYEDDDKILACIRAGAKGYLLKSEKMAFIVHTLEEVMAGGSQMSTLIARKVFRLLQEEKNIPAQKPKIELLTTREQEILQFVRQGLKYKVIANQLNISEETVKKHIRNIYEKLGVHDKISAVRNL